MTAFWREGDSAIFAAMALAALVSAIAPTMAGPRVRPKSRSMLVAPLAMPAFGVGTLLTATTVMAVTAVLKPAPTTSRGTAMAAIERLVAGMAASTRSPMPIRAAPAASTQPGLKRCNVLVLTGKSATPMMLSRTNPTAVLSGGNSWMAESRMLVAYAVPR